MCQELVLAAAFQLCCAWHSGQVGIANLGTTLMGSTMDENTQEHLCRRA